MEELLSLLGLGGGLFATGSAYNKLGQIGEDAPGMATEIGQQAADMSQFKGYGVTGPTGGAQVDTQGQLGLNLSPEMQQQMGLFSGLSSQFGQQAGTDPMAREGDVYERIRAMQRPEEQRQALGMEERLAAQGRTGLRTAQFGGAPEQFAMNQAQQEAQNQAALMAMQQAQQEQMQQGQLSSMFGQMQFAPQSALLDTFGAASQGYGFADVGRRQAANQLAEARMGGLDTALASRLGQTNVLGDLGQGLLSGGFGLANSAINSPEGFQNPFGFLSGLIGGN